MDRAPNMIIHTQRGTRRRAFAGVGSLVGAPGAHSLILHTPPYSLSLLSPPSSSHARFQKQRIEQHKLLLCPSTPPLPTKP
ncbi:hypothetical protein ACLOJK_034042 [Asimina triloba]